MESCGCESTISTTSCTSTWSSTFSSIPFPRVWPSPRNKPKKKLVRGYVKAAGNYSYDAVNSEEYPALGSLPDS
jgi:hypothetical protein